MATARQIALERAKAVWERHSPDNGENVPDGLLKWVSDRVVWRRAYVSPRGGEAWCSRCGTRFPCSAEDGDRVTCPHCRAALKAEVMGKWSRSLIGHVQRLTAWEGYQVICTYLVTVRHRRDKGEEVGVWHIYDWLFSEDGGRWCFSKPVSVFGYNQRNPWRLDGRMTYCRNAEGGHRWRDGWRIDGFWPVRRYAPWARKLGMRANREGIDARDVLAALQTNPHFETVYKAGHPTLLGFILYGHGDRRWPQIKIALRAGFKFDDPKMWADHLNDLERLGRDTRNPKNIAPDDLRAAHGEAQEAIRRMREREEERRKADERRSEEESDRRYRVRMAGVLGFEVRSGDIVIRPLQGVDDFREEGEALHHCVYANRYYDEEGSVILGARVGGERTETIEVDARRMEVEQCRGRNNLDSPFHAEILALMESALPRLGRLLKGRGRRAS